MPREPVLLVEGFLHSNNLQVRRNAVAALAAIGNRASIERLVGLAAGGAASGQPQSEFELEAVRLQAEDELVRLINGGAAETVHALLDEQFSAPATQLAAYALVARLRRRGSEVALASTGTPASIEWLVSVAAGEENSAQPLSQADSAAVRLQAEHELMRLSEGKAAPTLQTVLDKRLQHHTTQLSTYALLNRLRRQGARLAPEGIGSQASVNRLAALAAEDERVPEVLCEEAEDDLVRLLEGRAAPTVQSVLEERIGNPATQHSTYALLVRLRDRGVQWNPTAIGCRPSVEGLVALVIGDEKAPSRGDGHLGRMRLAAQGDLSRLMEDDVAPAVHAVIDDRLRDRDTQLSAYLMLGRLGERCARLVLKRRGLPTRLRLAARARSRVHSRAWLRSNRASGGAVAGAAAVVLLAVYLLLVAPSLGIAHGLMVGTVKRLATLAPWVCAAAMLAAMRLASPVAAYPDRVATTLVEMGLALVTGAVALVAVLLALAADAIWTRGAGGKVVGSPSNWLFFIAAALLLPVAVRVGTVLADSLVRRARWSRPAQTLAGGCFGVVVATLLTAMGRADSFTASAPAAHRGWLLLLPAAFALAGTYAAVDAAHRNETKSGMAPDVPPGHRAAVASQRWQIVPALVVCLGAVALVSTFLAAPFLGAPSPGGRKEVGNVTADPERKEVWTVTTVPDRQSFTVETVEVLKAVAPVATESMPHDLELRLLGDSEALGESFFSSRTIEMALEPGRYSVEVKRADGEAIALNQSPESGHVFPLLASRIPGLGRPWKAVAAQVVEEARRGADITIERTPNLASAPRAALDLTGRRLVRGRIDEALALYAQIETAHPDSISPMDRASVCLLGAVWNQPRAVLPTCNRIAAEEHPARNLAVIGRSIALALTGDLNRAADDLASIKVVNGRYGVDIVGDVRVFSQWRDALRQGQNPFTEEALAGIRQRLAARFDG